jgi:glycosyltransferase involved in cell wall biosynthesis
MAAYEADACRSARNVVAVSEADANEMRKAYGVSNIAWVPTGVDVEYFTPAARDRSGDLLFIGSMDWAPNVDGALWFAREVLPLIRRTRPMCKFAIVGRQPPPEILALAANCIEVTGTVPDIRPYLWGAPVAVVPLRIGGGTRLKIYEAMAARTAVVSTSIGAEGLAIIPGEQIAIADQPQAFAEACVELLENEQRREKMAHSAWQLVMSKFTWDAVVDAFEPLLV